MQCWAVQCVEADTRVCCAADGVIHTAFMHDGSVSYGEAIKIDCAAITAMTDAMAGTNKPFVMSSGTGGRVTPLILLLPILRALPQLVRALGKGLTKLRCLTGVMGDTGPHPMTEDLPIDPGHALAPRANTDRVSLCSVLDQCIAQKAEFCRTMVTLSGKCTSNLRRVIPTS